MKKIVMLMTVAGLLVMISGCVFLGLPEGSKKFQVIPPKMREAQLAKLKFWRIGGAFSIQRGRKAEIANFSWDQLGRRNYRIHITSAFRLYSLAIFSRFGFVTLWKNGTHAMNAKNPEELMRKAVGWSLPIVQLFYWIKGIPAPKKTGTYEAIYDTYGHLFELKQAGWTIKYGVYKTVHGEDLPQSIKMSRPGTNAKIVIKYWKLEMRKYPMPSVAP